MDAETVAVFKEFLNRQDKYVDDRGDTYDKLMRPGMPDWPENELRSVLDRIMPGPYEIENADFVRSRYHTRLHTDSDNGDQKRLFKNVIIPIEVDTFAATAVFENCWPGPAAKFTRIVPPQYEYQLTDIHGEVVYIEDIRLLYNAMSVTTKSTVEYQGHMFDNVTEWLADLIAKRHQVIPRISDYTGISGITQAEFPPDFHREYLSHIPIENLHGLQVPRIMEWRVGDAITFDRQCLHSGTSKDTIKSMVAVFTYHP